MITRNKRIFWSIVFMAIPFGAKKIANIIRKFHIFGSVGDNCLIQIRKIPYCTDLIFLHDNVVIGANVEFAHHDAIHIMLNQLYGSNNFIEKIGCVEIMNNVFIGSGTRIAGNVRIGNNVIIGANSLVTKDIPDNTVVSGVPAKYICDFEDFVETRIDYSNSFKTIYGLDSFKDADSATMNMLYNNFCKEKDAKRKRREETNKLSNNFKG